MKGVIVHCLEELVTTRFGGAAWQATLKEAGLKPATMFLVVDDIDDAVVMNIIAALSRHLKLSIAQLADMFGEYWVTAYSQKLYARYYATHANAKAFLLDLNEIHVTITKTIKQARPPRFTYEWKDERTLLMRYISHRRLLDIAVGLVKGVAKQYHEELDVKKISADTLQITF